MLDIIGLGTPFVDYFLETDNAYLKKIGLKPEDDFLFSEKKLSEKNILKNLKLVSKSVGGMSNNTISVLANLGVKCGFYGQIGKDEESKYWRKNMEKVDVSKIKSYGITPRCFCLLTDNGANRTFLSEPNKNEDIFFRDIDFNYLNETKFIHLSPFINQNIKSSFTKLKKLVNKIDKPLLSFTPSLFYIDYGLKKLIPIFKKTYVLFLNKKEIKLLTKMDIKKGSKYLLKFGPKIIVCTLGKNGVLVSTKKQQFIVKSIKVKNIVDSTGAGDAFAAGFLYGLLKQKTLKESAKLGVKIAIQSLSDYGQNWLRKLIV